MEVGITSKGISMLMNPFINPAITSTPNITKMNMVAFLFNRLLF